MTTPWICQRCGETHDTLPLTFGAEAPWRTFVPESEFEDRVQLFPDLMIIDQQHAFVRAHLEIPILDHPEVFTWSVWSSVSGESFDRMKAHFSDPDRVSQPPYFGWLSTELPVYTPSTWNLKTHLWERPPGQVPRVAVEPTGHPLAVEQQEGLTLAQVQERVHALLHDVPTD